MSVGLPTDAIIPKSIEVKPDPPLKGANITVKVVGTVNEVIEVAPVLLRGNLRRILRGYF
jgi:hypothetical protein